MGRLGFDRDGRAERFDSEFVRPIIEYSTHTIDRICGAVGLPTQGFFVSDVLAWFYDRHLFKNSTLASLPGMGEGPLFGFDWTSRDGDRRQGDGARRSRRGAERATTERRREAPSLVRRALGARTCCGRPFPFMSGRRK